MRGETLRAAGQYAALTVCVAGMVFCWTKGALHLREAQVIVSEGFVVTSRAPIARAVWIPTSASDKEHSARRELR
jgi:hypothetical protein